MTLWMLTMTFIIVTRSIFLFLLIEEHVLDTNAEKQMSQAATVV
jgi:hypothetical protein